MIASSNPWQGGIEVLSEDVVVYHVREGIGRITLNRPRP